MDDRGSKFLLYSIINTTYNRIKEQRVDGTGYIMLYV